MAGAPRLPEDIESQHIKAKNAALRLLTHRPRSEAEIRRRLQGRFTGEVVDRTLSDLLRQGLLDDAAFAREWRKQREKFRPRGSRVIRQELQRLGVDLEIIREALSDFDAAANAYRAGSRYAAKLPVGDDMGFRRKLGGFLHRRGALMGTSSARRSNGFGGSYLTRWTARYTAMPRVINTKMPDGDGPNIRLTMNATITDPAAIYANPLLRLALTEALISSPAP